MLFPLLLKYIWYKYTKSLVQGFAYSPDITFGFSYTYFIGWMIDFITQPNPTSNLSLDPRKQEVTQHSFFLKNVLRVLQFFRMLPILPIKNAPIFQY